MSDAISLRSLSAESSPACRNAERAASLDNVTRLLAHHFGPRPISVYEAGGGSTSYIPLDGLNVSRITLVDIDPHRIHANVTFGHQLRRKRAAFHDAGEPQPFVEPLTRFSRFSHPGRSGRIAYVTI